MAKRKLRQSIFPQLFVNANNIYVGSNARILSAEQVRAIIDADIESTVAAMDGIASHLQNGDIGIIEFRDRMRDTLKHLHLANVAAANGGVQALNASDRGLAVRLLQDQYRYLDRFVAQIALNPSLIDNPSFARRVQMYAQAARVTFERARLKRMKAEGYRWARRILHAAEHCFGCVEGALAGWVPIDEIIPIGGYECNIHCKCTIKYSKAKRNPSFKVGLPRQRKYRNLPP